MSKSKSVIIKLRPWDRKYLPKIEQLRSRPPHLALFIKLVPPERYLSTLPMPLSKPYIDRLCSTRGAIVIDKIETNGEVVRCFLPGE